ncbi:MAG: MFS transporter [Candidatus Nanoarchaeia archaeon]
MKEFFKANTILFFVLLGNGLATALLSVYFASIGISLTNIGAIFSIGTMAAGFLRIPVGAFVDKYGRKSFLMIGTIGYTIFAIGLCLVISIPYFVFLNFLVELSGAIFWTAWSAYFFDILEKNKEGEGFATRNMVMYLAMTFSPVLAGIIASNLGFTNLFIIAATVSLLALFLCLTIKDHNQIKISFVKEYLDVIKIKKLRRLIILLSSLDFVFVFWSIFMPIWLKNQGVSLEAIGALLSINLLFCALMQRPLGKAIDSYNLNKIVIPGAMLFVVGSILFFTFRNFLSYAINRMIVGISSDMIYWPGTARVAKIAPKKEHGVIVAVVFGISTIFRGIGSLIGGILTNYFGIDLILPSASIIFFIFTILMLKQTKLFKSAKFKF